MLRLADRHRLVFYDQRGGGRSRHHDDRSTITWASLVAELALVARELAISPLSIVGYSFGGLLALLYSVEVAADRLDGPVPERLILIDPAPITREHRRAFESEFARRQSSPAVQSLRDDLATSGLRERDPEAYRQRAFELSVAGYFADPARAHDLTPFRVTGRVQRSGWESLGDFDLRESLRAVQAPALVVHGREDPIPLASSEDIAAALPRARLVVLDHSGHVPYVEAPAALFDAIDHFLAETGTNQLS